MTIYTYKCLDCDNIFKIEATIQENEENVGDKFICSKCQSENLKQEFSVGNFFRNVFNGDSGGSGCCETKKGSGSCCSDKKDKGGCCG